MNNALAAALDAYLTREPSAPYAAPCPDCGASPLDRCACCCAPACSACCVEDATGDDGLCDECARDADMRGAA